MPVLATAAALTPAILQGAAALRQSRLAKNLKPSTYIPGALQESEAISRAHANATMAPGQARAEDKVDQQTANTLGAVRSVAKDSSTVLEKIQEADAMAKSKKSDIQAQAQEFIYQNQKNLQNVLREKAQYQQKNADDFSAAKSALKGAAMTNTFNAFQNAATAGLMLGKETPDPGVGADSVENVDTTPSAVKANPNPIPKPQVAIPTDQDMINAVNNTYPQKIKSPYFIEEAKKINPYGFMKLS